MHRTAGEHCSKEEQCIEEQARPKGVFEALNGSSKDGGMGEKKRKHTADEGGEGGGGGDMALSLGRAASQILDEIARCQPTIDRYGRYSAKQESRRGYWGYYKLFPQLTPASEDNPWHDKNKKRATNHTTIEVTSTMAEELSAALVVLQRPMTAEAPGTAAAAADSSAAAKTTTTTTTRTTTTTPAEMPAAPALPAPAPPAGPKRPGTHAGTPELD